MKKTKLTRSLLAACSIVVLSAVAYGCSSGISQGEADRQAQEAADQAAEEAKMAAEEAARKAETDRLADIQAARDAIAAAETAEAAQAAKDAVDDIATGTEAAELQGLVDARMVALAMMAREAEQKMALMTAADAIDTSEEALSTQDGVDAARTAIAALRQAIEDAADVDDTSMYQSRLDAAVTAVDEAQGGIDTDTRRTNQMDALMSASTTLQSALAALSGSTPTQAQLDAANNALTALNAAITGGADLTVTEKAPYQREADNAAAPIATAQMAFDDAEDEDAKAANAAMAATAAKLHAGIYASAADATGTNVGDVHAAYNDAGNPTGSTADTHIIVTTGDGTTANGQALSEDKDATVAALNGWTGKRYTASGTGVDGTYEAMVYSHVGDPTEGDKFNAQYTDLDGTTGERSIDTGTPAVQELVASSRFDQSAGTKEFELGTNLQRVIIAGSFHGVSGTYYCTPAASSTCAVQVAAKGFTLGGTADADNAFTVGGGTWTFKPSNAEARVMSTPDTSYASYGWWLHTAANGDLTASAFVDRKGAAEAASGITALQGTATYMGGAVGKYALSSTTGGTNDAGHFTARAMLEANFNDDTISGTIDNFMGAGGAKDWSVELMTSAISDGGAITGTAADAAAGAQMTQWTIGETAADAAGSWSGSLQENGDDGVPAIATGTFYSTYGTAGKMVGAFGANKQ